MSVKFYNENQVLISNITSSAINSQYPLTNLKDPRRTKTVKSTSNTLTIVFDFFSPVPLDSCIMVDSKIDLFGFDSAIVELNTSDSWGSPAYSQSLAIDLEFGFASAIFSSTQTFRFARLSFTKASGFVEVSKVFFGSKLDLETNTFTYPISYRNINKASEVTNRYAQRFFDETVTQKSFQASINTMTVTEVEKLFSLSDYNSNTIPLFVHFESIDGLNNPSRLSGMYYLEDAPSFQLVPGNYWNTSLNFVEAT